MEARSQLRHRPTRCRDATLLLSLLGGDSSHNLRPLQSRVIRLRECNPCRSAWLSLKQRAGLVAGETVFISGSSGVAGRLAVQFARRLGAKRVIGAGRNLESLQAAGVDSMIRLDEPEDSIRKALGPEV